MSLVSSSVRLPQLQAALTRSYSAQAARAVAGGQEQDVKVSTLDNGVRLASIASPTPGLAHIGVFMRAGSRYETYETQGAAHALQMAAGLASRNHSFFSIVRNVQQAGSMIQAQQGRETVMYGASFTQDKVDQGVDFLIEAATNPAFKSWELSDSFYRMELAVKSLSQCQRAVELLHKAAFRDGLGNSIYSPDFMLGKHKAPLVQGFYNKNVTSHRTALVGVGVDQQQLVKYANLIKLDGGQGEAAKAKYFGGEQRCDRGGATATICLAGPAAGMTNEKECVAAYALQIILGGGQRVKYGAVSGKLTKALADVSADVQSAEGIAFPYSDMSLAGVQMVVNAASAGKAVSAVAATLRSLSITDADLAGAKKAMAMNCTDMGPAQRAQWAGEELLYTGNVMDAQQINDAIANVSLGEVQAVAKKAFGGKLSMSAVGNLSTVPYLDSL